MQKPFMHTLIGRVLSGEASSFEQRQVSAWIQESPENGETFRMVEEAWEESRFKFSYPRQNDVFNKISQHIHSDVVAEEERPSAGNRHIKWYRYAALWRYWFLLRFSFSGSTGSIQPLQRTSP